PSGRSRTSRTCGPSRRRAGLRRKASICSATRMPTIRACSRATSAEGRRVIESTMMEFPLTLGHVLARAERLFGASEIVSRRPDRSLHRYTYRDFHRRASALAGAVQRLGLRKGERVATLMWNHYAHLEAYFAVPCAGGVVHTLNLRLAPDDLAYIARHAGDRFL